MAKRGSYAKGVAKREEILTSALDVIAREGFRKASVREIADAVGLSQAGLLHYFGSKEQLFVEIMRKRDEVDTEHFDLDSSHYNPMREGYLRVIRHNSEVPGVVELFSRLAVEASDVEHPAHEYFLQRSALIRELFTKSIAEEQEAGRVTDKVDAEVLARILQAVSDGMQLQWLLDRDVDMAATVDALFTLLGAAPANTAASAPAGETSTADS
ncbi:TetR/AcrR family transcriptional regulator [Microbacterium sp. ASV49]|uniref:TetR/AcrR family transcriptional regulator n=1 Tax=Microbacterium candidum TaxID=3041922 RepID=A0ABT7MXQ2_9MICO|nr:TetR/AcrR family transcriptional regulator [Microbacterium sp. ASV49]MDL9979234.1 TetR/AcrR family transcriptional regulator [Microbacterium sp. ASV49]